MSPYSGVRALTAAGAGARGAALCGHRSEVRAGLAGRRRRRLREAARPVHRGQGGRHGAEVAAAGPGDAELPHRASSLQLQQRFSTRDCSCKANLPARREPGGRAAATRRRARGEGVAGAGHDLAGPDVVLRLHDGPEQLPRRVVNQTGFRLKLQ